MNQKKILIVEDEPLIALELKETLEHEGYLVCEPVAKAEDVLKAYVEHKPDILVMDINLGGYSDGIDAIERLRLLKKDLQVIYITAYDTTAARNKADKTRPAAYLTKPVQNKLLLSVIRRCFKNLLHSTNGT